MVPAGGTVGLETVAEGLTSPVWLGAAGDGLAKVWAAVEILSGADERNRTRSRGVDRFHLAIATALGLIVV